MAQAQRASFKEYFTISSLSLFVSISSEYRYRKRLEDDRHKQIEKAMKLVGNQGFRLSDMLSLNILVPCWC